MADPKLVYVGKLRWPYRFRAAWIGLGIFVMALRGYELEIESEDDTGKRDALPGPIV